MDAPPPPSVRGVRSCGARTSHRPSRRFTRRFPVRRDLPGIAPAVLHHTATISIRRIQRLFERSRTDLQRPPVGCIRVLDVHIEKGPRRFSSPGIADHDDRVADPHNGWSITLIFAGCVEQTVQKRDEALRVPREQPWRNGMPASRCPLRMGHCFAHTGCWWTLLDLVRWTWKGDGRLPPIAALPSTSR